MLCILIEDIFAALKLCYIAVAVYAANFCIATGSDFIQNQLQECMGSKL